MRMNTSSRNHLSPRPTSLQSIGEQPAEALAPIPDGLVADHQVTGSEDRLDVTKVQTEAVIQPDRMLDDLRREAKATARVGRGVISRTLPWQRPRVNLTMPFNQL